MVQVAVQTVPKTDSSVIPGGGLPFLPPPPSVGLAANTTPVGNAKAVEPASIFKRFVAFYIDYMISLPFAALFIVGAVIMYALKDNLSKYGSPGRKFTDTIMVDKDTNEVSPDRIRLKRNLVTFLIRGVGALLILPPIIDLLLIVLRSDGRCIADLVFNTVIVQGKTQIST